MLVINIKELPIGFISDAHNSTGSIDAVCEKHPEVKLWIFLGDLIDFQKPERNQKTGEWLLKNLDKFKFIKGNHDHVASKGYLNIDHPAAWHVSQFHSGIQLELPDKTQLLCYHSKPTDWWSFIDKGKYTEREFVDDFPLKSWTRAVVIGHNHRTFIESFQDTDAEIWSPGAVNDGRYAIYDGKINMKTL